MTQPDTDALLVRRKRISQLFGLACGAATALCLLVLFGLLMAVGWSALGAFQTAERKAAIAEQSGVQAALTKAGVVTDPAAWTRMGTFLKNGPSRRHKKAGIGLAISGSLWLIGLTALFSVPLGVGAALYLEEYAPASRWKKLVQLNIANLAGVPSIVYGILGLGIFVRAVQVSVASRDYLVGLELGSVILSGALTLTLVVLPIIILAAQEALRAVPKSIRQGSYALGATRWQTTWRQVLPAALPGIMTGVILAVSRALGEAAPLVAVGAAAFLTRAPWTPYSEYTAMPLQIYNWAGMPQKEFHDLASAAIVVLLGVLILLNAIAIGVRYRFGQKIRW